MAKLKKASFPGISRQAKQSQSESAITENIELLTGQRGNGENRALLYKDLVNLDSMKAAALRASVKSGGNDGGLPITTGGVQRPHAPVNVSAVGGFTFIAISWDHPAYRGHSYAQVWRSETDTFANATLISTEVSDVFSDSVNMGDEYYYWVRFVNVADMEGPLQGAAGIYAKTVESAESILNEIGGKIENSHLGDFLTSEIGKIPAFDFMLGELFDNEIPALKVDIENIGVDVGALRVDVDKNLADIPDIKSEIESLSDELPDIKQELTDLTDDTESARQIADNAKQRIESIEISSDSLAKQLIESASINDLNWQTNTTKFIEFESTIDGMSARIESDFLTKTEANEAIAAAAETIRVEIEATGLALSGDIESTYYTKATTDEVIALAKLAIKSEIEDPEGNSVGALLETQHYTKVETDSAISFSAEQIKSQIEDPEGGSLGALISNDYYTSVKTNEAIAAYGLQLKSIIEDPNGSGLGALLKNDYYTITQADSAISEATTQLSSEVQEVDELISQVSSNLTNNYYTSAESDQAIATASQFLKSQIEDTEGTSLGATLFNDYSTKVDTEQAVSRAIFELNSQFSPLAQSVIENATANDQANERQQVITANILRTQEAITDESKAIAKSISVIETKFNENSSKLTEIDKVVSNNITSSAQKIFQLDSKVEDNRSFLEVNYFTKADTDTAISEVTTALKSEVESGFQSVLTSSYYTKADTNSAISQASTQLQSNIDGISSGLSLNYYTQTQADEAISQATTILQSAIEDPEGESVAADLYQNYLTSTQTGLAISEATQQLKSAIEDPEGDSLAADIYTNFSTKADTSTAISEATTALKSTLDGDIGSIASDLQNNYRTEVETDLAISQATTVLKSEIEDPEGNSLGATLFNDFQTKVDADKSTATTSQQLRAEFEPSAQSVIENALANDLGQERRTVAEADIINKQTAFADESKAITESLQVLNSSFGESAAQLSRIQETFANKEIATSKEILNLSSNLENVTADLVNNYFTSADANEAIASADMALRAAIEDPNGNSIGADLQTNYYTKASADGAIAEATTQLKAAIEDPNGNSIGADLVQTYLTKADSESALSQATTALESRINDTESSLYNNYYTSATVDLAIAQSESGLSSQINGVSSNLYNNYYTKASANEAISQANQILKSEVDGVSSELEQLSQTVASNNGDFSALWGVKTNVNGIQSSIGLVNDGLDPIFAVKGAKFAVITDQSSTNLTPVFAVSGGKTVINEAIIDQAFIRSLVTDDLLADRLIIGSRLMTPSINYNPANGDRGGNFSIDPNGTMHAKWAQLQAVTIKDNYGNIMLSSGGISWNSISGTGKPQDGADKTSDNKSAGINVEDTRYDDNTADWYRSTKGMGSYTELKQRTALGIPGSGYYGTLHTYVPWRDSSGGSVVQTFQSDQGNWRRVSFTNGGWSSWSKAFDEQNKPTVSDIPDAGPFAGLSKILSSNVSTYIANGAIGSAQIDQAYINQLFGNNASFFGTVYAQNLEGDVTDLKVKRSSNVSASTRNAEYSIINFYIGSLPFARSVTVSGIQIKAYHEFFDSPGADVMLFVSGFSTARDVYNHEFSSEPGTETAVSRTLAAIIPAYTNVTVTLKIKKTSSGGTHAVSVPAQNVVCQTFKDGSTIS